MSMIKRKRKCNGVIGWAKKGDQEGQMRLNRKRTERMSQTLFTLSGADRCFATEALTALTGTCSNLPEM